MTIDTQKLRQQLAEATPGTWNVFAGRLYYERNKDLMTTTGGACWFVNDEDAALICSMKNSLPALLDELDNLRAFAREMNIQQLGLPEPQASIVGYLLNKYNL